VYSARNEVWYVYNLRKSSLYVELVGDIMSFHALGRVLIILSSTKATRDLLEKRARGDIFSDRPVIPFFEMYVL
jgi:hypothetical protein